MYGLVDWQFWLSAIWFGLAIFVSFYIPGSVLLRKTKLSALNHGLLAFVLGLTLWGFQGYVFGYLHVRWLTYLYVLLFGSVWLFSFSLEKQRLQLIVKDLRELPVVIWLTLIGGSLIQLVQVWTTGLKYGGELWFFRVNAYDGVLHLAFIEALVKQVPAIQPGAVGLPLDNYHYWSDLIAADLHRVWQLPIMHLFFQFMPVILAVGTGLAVYQVVKTWQGSTTAAVWSLLLLYLAGDLAYVFTLLLHGTWGSHVAAIDNGAMQLLNIPHGYAKMVFVTGLIPLTVWIKKQSLGWGLVTAVMFASLFGLKVYFGIFTAIGLSLVLSVYGSLALFKLLRGQTTLSQTLQSLVWLIVPYTVLALSAAIIYFPSNHDSGGLFWSPLEWPKLFLGADHIDWHRWWLLKQVFDGAQSAKGVIALDVIAIAICLLSVFGLRLIGLLPNPEWYRKIGWQLLVFFIPTSLICIFLGLYTLQVSGLFNVFNFFAVAAVPLALLTGLSLSSSWERRSLIFKVLPILVVAVGLPRIVMTTTESIRHSVDEQVEQRLTVEQQEAMAYFRDQTPSDSLIQSHPQNSFDRRTPFLAFFANRQTYLTGISMLESHNQPIEDRQAQLTKIFDSTSSLLMKSELHAEGIDYLYLEKTADEKLPFALPDDNLPAVFENSQTLILEVNR